MRSNNILPERLPVCHMAAAWSERWNFQRKRSKQRSKVHSCGILDQGELQRGKKWSVSPPSMPCLSDLTTKLTAGDVSMYSTCVCELCVRKRAWNQQAGGIVAGMITSLDLSHGKNKPSISHYLPFNQIPSFFFFASLPQNCHRLKRSPFLIKEPRVQLIPRQGEFYSETLMHTERIAKTPASPPSGKWVLTFNLFQEEMECYVLTTVNRGGTREERGNQAAHQLQGPFPVTFNSPSDHTICLAWYAHAILRARAVAVSSASSTSTVSSVSILITTEHFHAPSMPQLNQITATTPGTSSIALT